MQRRCFSDETTIFFIYVFLDGVCALVVLVYQTLCGFIVLKGIFHRIDQRIPARFDNVG